MPKEKKKDLREKQENKDKEEGTRGAHQNWKYLNGYRKKNLKGITCYSLEQRCFTLVVGKDFQTANF